MVQRDRTDSAEANRATVVAVDVKHLGEDQKVMNNWQVFDACAAARRLSLGPPPILRPTNVFKLMPHALTAVPASTRFTF